MKKQWFFNHPAWFNPKTICLPEFAEFRGIPLETSRYTQVRLRLKLLGNCDKSRWNYRKEIMTKVEP